MALGCPTHATFPTHTMSIWLVMHTSTHVMLGIGCIRSSDACQRRDTARLTLPEGVGRRCTENSGRTLATLVRRTCRGCSGGLPPCYRCQPGKACTCRRLSLLDTLEVT